MKKLATLILALAMILSPLKTQAANQTPAPTISKDGTTVIFHPAIEKVKQNGNSTTVTVNTSSTAYMYVIQVSNYPDFRDATPYYKRGSDWQKGCVALWLTDYKGGYKRIFWYNGEIISYRESSKKLSVPLKLLRQIEQRYTVKKTFTVPERGRYVRFRTVYYGGGAKCFSEWSVKKVR